MTDIRKVAAKLSNEIDDPWLITMKLAPGKVREFHNRGVWVRWSKRLEKEFRDQVESHTGILRRLIEVKGVSIVNESLTVTVEAPERLLGRVEDAIAEAARVMFYGASKGDHDMYEARLVFRGTWDQEFTVEKG